MADDPRHSAVLTPPLKDLLPTWMSSQRWYAGKGRLPRLRRLGGFRLDDPSGEVGVETLIVADMSAEPAVVYQVPLTYRGAPLAGAEGALVATASDNELDPRWIYDGPHDPVYARELMGLILKDSGRDVVVASSSVLVGEQSHTSIICQLRDGTGAAAGPVIVKVFRLLQAGQNPEVAVQIALSAAGSTCVPETVGYVTGRWLAPDHVESQARHEAHIEHQIQAAVRARTAAIAVLQKQRQQAAARRAIAVEQRRLAQRPSLRDELLGTPTPRRSRPAVDERARDDLIEEPAPAAADVALPRIPGRAEFAGFEPERHEGHLAFAQRFFPGVEDAWRLAVRAAARSVDFSRQARELGEATARIHRQLAEAFGTTPATESAKSQLLASIRSRYFAATSEVPALAEQDRAIRAVVGELADLDWPDLQRIHGDYHLGQVLHVVGRGWVAFDFEGEPLRPLAERVRPDLPQRDVAGMLRSLDYAATSAERSRPGHSVQDWARACRGAFLDGYAEVTGRAPDQDAEMIRALEVDKALYEVVYEARNRPTWLSIPVQAIDRLVAGGKAGS